MTGKASAVFWIGLILIFANFWITGQSSTLWESLTEKSSVSSSGTAPSGGLSSGSPGNQNPVLGPKGSRPL
jgi:hypothetical protein